MSFDETTDATRRTRLANIFSGGAREDETHAPRLGEHTEEILQMLGLHDDEIQAARQQGAI